ncbi:Gfo/Idh/MocA family oxidoreductase [Pseudomonadota bacterium]
MMKNFALIGAAGFIAPRHMEAIKATGNRLVAAVDPHDSVGVLDNYFSEAAFFTEIERFDRYLERLRRSDAMQVVEYVSICSPNYLHDAHIRLALRVRAHAICEKPMVLTPKNIDALKFVEHEYDRRVYNVLQLRVHNKAVQLKKKLEAQPLKDKVDVELSYITRRGAWYAYSWKGDPGKSGGIAMNIGIHIFDMLTWLFGAVESATVHLNQPDKMAGFLELEQARVKWFLSVDGNDLPVGMLAEGVSAFRSIIIDGEEIDFTNGVGDLHNRVYQDILSGGGYGVEDARPAVELVHKLNNLDISTRPDHMHPLLRRN